MQSCEEQFKVFFKWKVGIHTFTGRTEPTKSLATSWIGLFCSDQNIRGIRLVIKPPPRILNQWFARNLQLEKLTNETTWNFMLNIRHLCSWIDKQKKKRSYSELRIDIKYLYKNVRRSNVGKEENQAEKKSESTIHHCWNFQLCPQKWILFLCILLLLSNQQTSTSLCATEIYIRNINKNIVQWKLLQSVSEA